MNIFKKFKKIYNTVDNFLLNNLVKPPEPKTLLEIRVRELCEALRKKNMTSADIAKSKAQDITKKA